MPQKGNYAQFAKEVFWNPENMVNIVVLVLGDVGRSPRMQYHALSLANRSGSGEMGEQSQEDLVYLVGYSGSACLDAIESHPRIKFCRFSPLSGLEFLRIIFPLYLLLKVVYLSLMLLIVTTWWLPTVRHSSFISGKENEHS